MSPIGVVSKIKKKNITFAYLHSTISLQLVKNISIYQTPMITILKWFEKNKFSLKFKLVMLQKNN